MGYPCYLDEIELITYLYDINKRTNALEQEYITKTLGKIGDDSVVPILMEIANMIKFL